MSHSRDSADDGTQDVPQWWGTGTLRSALSGNTVLSLARFQGGGMIEGVLTFGPFCGARKSCRLGRASLLGELLKVSSGKFVRASLLEEL